VNRFQRSRIKQVNRSRRDHGQQLAVGRIGTFF
jgi:hypothetical protein